MSAPTPAPAGSWRSPLTSEQVVAASVRLAQPSVSGDCIYWLEGRPQEKGRVVLVRQDREGHRQDLTPAPFSVRSRAHEYGGGAYLIADDRAFFVNAEDQCIYLVDGDDCRALTRPGSRRFADLCFDGARRRLIAVCEDHAGDGEAQTTLVAIALDDGAVTTLAAGEDFYSSPALDARGKRLAWLSWSHPNMPWDETVLNLAEVNANGELQGQRRLGRRDASIFQPTWGNDGKLYYTADYTDWWNLYCHDGESESALTDERCEFALGQWIFGMSTFALLDEDTILAMATRDGLWSLLRVDLPGGHVTRVKGCDYGACDHLAGENGRAALLAGGATTPLSVLAVTLNGDDAECQLLRSASATAIDPGYLSQPEALSYASGDGEAHGFYYAPANAAYRLADDEKPPLLVKCHGGPTAATSTALDPRIQFWTSRGFAVLDVNYRGSTGFGRAYRRSLYGQWGVFDVDDCVNGARALIERGLADPRRCLISGSSAGGYTVLSALAFRDTFAAGASYYGIGDLALLTDETHKFEARYTERLVGPWPAARALYRERSPLHHADGIGCPVIFFQGLDDKVVPPNQALSMVAALRERGLPVAYVPFEGEGHGFRNAANIRYALDAELAFYGRVLGFEPADGPLDLAIDNLD